jgi:glycosyltransferase involved in cell wall biosynthesis
MKLLFVHDRFGADAGAEANAFITATEFSKRGHRCAILHGPGTGRNEAAWREAFSETFPLPLKPSRADVRQTICAFQPDLIYVHKMSVIEVLQGLVDSGIPLVHMVHDHDIYCMRSYKYFYLSREICRRAASPYCIFPCGAFIARNRNGGFPLKYVSYRAKRREIALNQQFHRMIVVTRYMREELLRNGFDASRIEILAPAPRMGDPTIRSSFSQRNLIIYAGQIIRGKGVDVLLRALALVREPFECIILGDGNHAAACRKLCRRLGLEDRVRFLGFIPQEELIQHYRECSLVAISSVWPEPYATIGVEVSRYALPIVAFDVGGLRDWLTDGENGFLVPPMNIELYARRIEQLLTDKALAREMGLRGLERINQLYDFNRYIPQLENIFERVIAETNLRRNSAILSSPS